MRGGGVGRLYRTPVSSPRLALSLFLSLSLSLFLFFSLSLSLSLFLFFSLSFCLFFSLSLSLFLSLLLSLFFSFPLCRWRQRWGITQYQAPHLRVRIGIVGQQATLTSPKVRRESSVDLERVGLSDTRFSFGVVVVVVLEAPVGVPLGAP